MVIEEALDAYLKADTRISGLAGARGYPNLVPQEIQRPSWAYQRIGGPRLLAHDGPSGIATGRFQFTCQGDSYGDAKDLANALRLALDGYKGPMGGVWVEEIRVENEFDGYNAQSGVQTVRLDILVVYQE